MSRQAAVVEGSGDDGPGDEILVFGASSQIGDALLPLLSGKGHRLLAISRNPPANRPGLRWQRGCFDTLKQTPRRVISLGPLRDFARWLDTVEGVERVIAVGSVSLRHKRGSSAPEEREVAAQLQQAEQQLRQRAAQLGAELTLLRPCLLYGAGRDQTVAPALRFALDRGWMPLPMPANGLRQPLHVADLAEAICQCLEGAAIGQTLELGGAEQLSFSQLLQRIALSVSGCHQRRLPMLPLRWVSAIAAPWSVRMRRINRALLRANVDQVADDALSRQCLDWHPREFQPRQESGTVVTSK